ncbi:Sec-independent protein translocase subunit TatA [Sphaerisporangium sp. TRM90804]|uniref:Sec-independent protein translocase subunit TatA n=1 Tax=Sphaerisporangium sp. TRM90804 TaxID=3031113 RepID=UPI002448001A|nr:Sec-independent protein translocase subunit TatA [Sphaerisporangium sp. TRM90804]MDH2430646.1 Sec-independent protein translocase subunit TatA [Sphaerisporangium sp. TRM90804]
MPSLGPMEWILILLVLILLFGAKKLPDTARALGQSLRLFKKETAKDEQEEAARAAATADQPVPPVTPPQASLPPATPSVDERLRALEEENARLRTAQARTGEAGVNGTPLTQAQKDQGSL